MNVLCSRPTQKPMCLFAGHTKSYYCTPQLHKTSCVCSLITHNPCVVFSSCTKTFCVCAPGCAKHLLFFDNKLCGCVQFFAARKISADNHKCYCQPDSSTATFSFSFKLFTMFGFGFAYSCRSFVFTVHWFCIQLQKVCFHCAFNSWFCRQQCGQVVSGHIPGA